MNISPELFVEWRNWVIELDINKHEVFLVFIVALIAWRLPVILNFYKEMRVIDLDAKERRMSLEAKIVREQQRRQTLKRKK